MRGRGPRPVEALLAAVRGTVYARPRAGFRLRLRPSRRARSGPGRGRGARVEASLQLLRPLVALGKRLEAVLDDGPMARRAARARFEARWRPRLAGAELARLYRAAARIADPPTRIRRLASVERVEGRILRPAFTAIGSTRPGLSRKRCSSPHVVLVTSATLRGGAAARGGGAHRRPPLSGPGRASGASPLICRAQRGARRPESEGDWPRSRRLLSRPIEALGRTLGLFHRHPSPQAFTPALATASPAPACRSTPSMSIRSTPSP